MDSKHMYNKIKILMEDAVIIKNSVYFVSREWNSLYSINLDSDELNFISIIPEENILSSRLCGGIMHHDEKLIFVPMAASKIWIYDLKRDRWQGLERKVIGYENSRKEMFRAVEYNNNMFFIGSYYPAIIKMDLERFEVEYWQEPYKFLTNAPDNGECDFRSDFALVGNRLCLASCRINFVLSVNLDTLDFKWLKVGEDNFRYSGITWDGENYWLSPRRGTPIVRWNGNDQAEYFPLPEEFENKKYNFLGVSFYDGKLIFPGMFQNRTIVIDPQKPNDMDIREGQYIFFKHYGIDELLLQTVDGLFQWHKAGRKLEELYCEMQFSDLRQHFKTYVGKTKSVREQIGLFEESMLLTLPLYVLKVNQGLKVKRSKLEDGEAIWKIIRS